MSDPIQKKPTSDICTACGICCDGTLFTYVSLKEHEIKPLEASPLVLRHSANDKIAFSLGCTCLKDGLCSIYDIRPDVCRNYMCALPKSVTAGHISQPKAYDIIDQAKKNRDWLLAQNITVRAEVKIPKEQTDILSMWAEPAPESNKPKNLRTILYDLYPFFDKGLKNQTLDQAEKDYILNAYDHLVLLNQYFQKIKLTLKYANLVQRIHNTQVAD